VEPRRDGVDDGPNAPTHRHQQAGRENPADRAHRCVRPPFKRGYRLPEVPVY